jgi:uncharacterized SAM-binding protein YcdF (DUF218 family)
MNTAGRASHRTKLASHPQRPKQHRWLRVIGVVCLVLLLLGMAAYALRRPLLTGFANALTVDDDLVPADFIYLLGGDAHIRPVHAARLFRDGLAPQVVITTGGPLTSRVSTTPDSADSVVQLLRLEGVPDSSIAALPLPPGAASTQDEGQALRRYLQEHPAQRVIVVTSAYHSRRARWTLRRELKGVNVDLRMSAAPDPRFNASNWWQNEEGFVAYLTEALKFVHTLVRSP